MSDASIGSDYAAELAARTVTLTLPGMTDVTVIRDLPYGLDDDNPLTFDLYRPPEGIARAPHGAVVIAAGYPDRGVVKFLGRPFKDLGATVSWAALIAASGVVAIAYTNREPDADLGRILSHVRAESSSLGIDADRLGLFATSGNAPVALARAMRTSSIRPACIALGCPLTLDLDGASGVADAARMFGFSNPSAGASLDDVRPDVPLHIFRAGGDETPGLNDALDRFVRHALARDLPLTLASLAEARHSFELYLDTPAAHGVVRQTLEFLVHHLVT